MRPNVPSSVAFSLGPGPLTPAVRALVAANVVGYLLTLVLPSLSIWLGLVPALMIERGWLWQPITYMFLHGSIWQADDNHAAHAAGIIDFHFDDDAFKTNYCAGKNTGKHEYILHAI